MLKRKFERIQLCFPKFFELDCETLQSVTVIGQSDPVFLFMDPTSLNHFKRR